MTHFIKEEVRKVPVVKKIGVLVIGGGPAGMIAALAAARNGTETLLIEQDGFLGGMLTAGLVQVIAPLHDRAGSLVIKGIPLEFIERLWKQGGMSGDLRAITWLPHDSEATKYVADQMMEEARVEVLFHSLCVDAVLEEKGLKGVIIESKSGRQAVLAKVVIDATGDADVAYYSKVPYEKGWPETGLLQPMTLSFRMGGVRLSKWPHISEELKRTFEEAVKQYGPVGGQRGLGVLPLIREEECFINKTRIAGDGTNVRDLTRAEIEGRKQAWRCLKWYREHLPGFENAYIMQSAYRVGVRETRRIMGEYVLTKEDILGARDFPDGIMRGAYWIDIHDPRSNRTEYVYLKPGTSYAIPYRCLVPKKVDGLLVAGRCISGTYEAAASYRIMSHCMAMGQAAGTAAALCVKTRREPRELDVRRLQSKLIEQGAVVNR